MAKDLEDKASVADLLVQARITNRLLAAQLKEKVGQQELVRLLAGSGASHGEIANVLDTTVATVATTMQRLRKRAKGSVPANVSAAHATRDDMTTERA
jgi:DNA-directed RNA polymerase specialized sigma24 family protein